jgi:uncharacterized protein (TIGR02145 family)
MKSIITLAATLGLAITLTATLALAQEKSTFTDTRDKKTYKTVKIGKQVWMAENLNFEAKEGSMCYDNKPDNCKKYGRLYYWETATEVCPNGWHLPDDTEWDKLLDYVDGTSGTENYYMSETAGKYLKAKSWDKNNGTDKFGFSALPGGECDNSAKYVGCVLIGINGFWWGNASNEFYLFMTNIDDIVRDGSTIDEAGDFKRLLSVRCIQN